MSDQDRPSSSPIKSPCPSVKKEPAGDPMKSAFQQIQKYLEVLPPEIAADLKERMSEAYQRRLKHQKVEKEAERAVMTLGRDSPNGQILVQLLKTSKRVEKIMTELAEDTAHEWIKLGGEYFKNFTLPNIDRFSK